MKKFLPITIFFFLFLANNITAFTIEKSANPKDKIRKLFKNELVSTSAGEVISFDVLNSYLSIADNASFNLNEFTIETWFKWQPTGNEADFICSKSGSGMEIHTNANNSLRFLPVPGLYFDTNPNTISQNTWTHVACVYKPSAGLAKVYINGAEMALTQLGVNPINTPIVATSSPFLIGSRIPNGYPFLGQLDEFRIWNKALTQADIQYTINCQISTLAEGLIVNHHFNEGIAGGDNTGINTLTDLSGYNNHATLVNFIMNGATSNLVLATPGLTIQSGVFCSTEPPLVNNQTLCGGSTINNLVATGTNLKWYNAASGGSALQETTALQTGSYYVSQTIFGIESARVLANITINTTPFPTATSQALNSGDTIASLTAIGTDLKWYDVATNGIPLISTTILVTGTYYVTQTLNTCESERLIVDVSITTTLPIVNNQNFCFGATVNDLTASGSEIKWYDVATGGSPLLPTEVLTTGNYYVSQTLHGLESARVVVSVMVNSFIDAPIATAQTFCGNVTVSDLVATGTGPLKWYNVL